MSGTTAGILFLVALVVALAAVHVPLGDYMYRVYTTEKHLGGERVIYRLIGADPKAQQTWGAYVRSVLAFSAVSILFLFILQLVQGKLPLHLNDPGTAMTPALAWNTAVSFVTNTNWQAYSGESTQGHLVQMAGLAVQNFASAAVGMAIAMAFVRGLARRNTSELGNFWVDLVRGSIRILLPISIVGALILIAGGAIQNFGLHDQVVDTIAGAQQVIPGGPVASQEAIKELGTNGGGFFNVNSAHPLENPTPLANFIEWLAILLLPAALCYTFGMMVGDTRQGWALLAAMLVIFVPLLLLCYSAEQAGNPQLAAAGVDQQA
ncbi:MAG: potassium-transporting ATPase subunit KdpA, partial [Mycobacterium sp.]